MLGTGSKTVILSFQKFKVKEWPSEDYGKFYSGDSYIVLNVYKKEDQLLYDVHFWIGKRSTQVSRSHFCDFPKEREISPAFCRESFSKYLLLRPIRPF